MNTNYIQYKKKKKINETQHEVQTHENDVQHTSAARPAGHNHA